MVVVTLDQILKPNKEGGKLEPVTLYLDGFLKADYDFIRDRVLNHNDFFLLIIDGKPGTGKSTLGVQSSCYLNQKTTIKSIAFDLEQFEESLVKAKEGGVVLLDESFELNVRSSQSRANMRILSLLQQMREKKVFIILIIPCVYDLDKNVILSLCDLFIHTYREPFGRRGNYNIYDSEGLKKLWLFARQGRHYSYKITRPIYKGRFSKVFPLDYKAYRKKKISTLESFRKRETRISGDHYSRNEERNKIIKKLYDKGTTAEDIGNLVNLTKPAIYKILKKFK